jgi:hypothetical protein
VGDVSWHPSGGVRASAFVVAPCLIALGACATGGASGGSKLVLDDDGGATDGAPVDATSDTHVPPATDAGDSGSTTSASKACADYAAAYCMQLEMCAPFLVTVQFPSDPTPTSSCVTRTTLACADTLAAPGTGWTGDLLEACVKAETALDCGTFLDGKPLPDACRVTGQVITSDPCRYDVQCGSGYCRYTPGASCGNCVTLGETGAPCTTSSDCDGNLMCTAVGTGTGTCQPPSAVGGTCSATIPCQQGLVCLTGVCTAPGSLGAACNPANDGTDCDYDQGVYCDSIAKACKAYVVPQTGGPCGTQGTTCAGGGTCYKSACVAPAQDGATCAPTTGVDCLDPSTCQSGTCGLYTAAQCK